MNSTNTIDSNPNPVLTRKPTMTSPLFRIAIAIVGVASVSSCAFAQETSQNHALLIGIRNYDPDQFIALPSADNDANRLADLLQRGGYDPSNLLVLTNSGGENDPQRLPMKANILDQLKSLSENAKVDDTVIVAFSGHGLQDSTGTYLLCPFDADLEDAGSFIAIDDVYQALEACPSKHKLLMIDAMHGLPFAKGIEVSTARPFQARMPGLPTLPRNTAVFVSCSEGTATNINQLGNFFAAVADGIEGEAAGRDGSVTLPDVERYVKDQLQGSQLQPVLYNNTAGLFEITSQSLGEDATEKIQRLTRSEFYHEALEFVESRLAQNPNDGTTVAYRARLLSYIAEQYRDYSRIDEAMQDANRAIQLAPNEPLPYIARSNIYRIQKKYEKSFADASAAVQRDPNCVMAHVIRAFALHHLHDLEGMRREAQIGMEIDPEHPEARGIYVGYLFAKGRIQEGITEIDRIIAVTPTMPQVYFLKGYGFEKLGKRTEAIEQYTKAIELHDQVPGYYCRRAVSYANAGNHQAAMADIAAAEKVMPDYVEIASARVMVMQKRKGFGHAESAIAEGLKANPKSADLWQGRGFNFLNTRQYPQAIKAFEKALEINPSYGEVHMGIGMVYLKQNKLDEALIHLNRATRHKEHLARAYFEKCNVYLKKRDYNSALTEVDKALAYEPNDGVMRRQRQILISAGARNTSKSQAGDHSFHATPNAPPKPLSAEAAQAKASSNGKYSVLLKKIAVKGDVNQYGPFHDYGLWNEQQYAGYTNLPKGYWVYVYPNWYIWKDLGPSAPVKPRLTSSVAN